MGNKKGNAPPRYDEKFKEGAIRLVTEQGRPSKDVAAELGICIDTLRNWLKAAGAPSPGQADRQNHDAIIPKANHGKIARVQTTLAVGRPALLTIFLLFVFEEIKRPGS